MEVPFCSLLHAVHATANTKLPANAIKPIQSKCTIPSRNQNLGYAPERGKGPVLRCKSNIFMSCAYMMSEADIQTHTTEPLKH